MVRLPAAQQQGVADHADGAERHRGAGNHGVEQAEGGQRYADQVVDEGPEQVLAYLAVAAARDRDGGGHQRRIAAHQRDAGGVHGDVGAAGYGDADIGGGQRGGVVDAVADHGDASAAGLQAGDGGRFVGGQHVGDDAAYAQFLADGVGAALVVAGEQDGLDVHRLQRLQRGAGLRFDAVAEGQQAQ